MGVLVECGCAGEGLARANRESRAIRHRAARVIWAQAVERTEAEAQSGVPAETLREVWCLWKNYWCRNPECRAVKVSKFVLESEFIEHLQTLRPDSATVAQLPAIAADVWARRRGDTDAATRELAARLAARA